MNRKKSGANGITIGYENPELAGAARVLRAFLRRSGLIGPISMTSNFPTGGTPAMVLATRLPPALKRECQAESRTVLGATLDAYALRSFRFGGRQNLLILGNTKRSVWYGLFDYLQRWFGWFYDFHGDLRPAGMPPAHPIPPDWAIREIAAVRIRSYKPQILCNYSERHSAWAWGPQRWRQCVDWCVRQRYNMLHLMLFAQSNWIRFACASDACPVPDPYLTAAERIAMLRGVIRRCHDYGLKVRVGFCTNGTTFSYLRRHPDQATTSTSPYQGHLCWAKGQAHLLAVMREFVDTYAEADGFVLWPSEGLCQCAPCRTGRPFLKLVLALQRHLAGQYRGKELVLADWHFPTADFLAQYAGRLPKGIQIINFHREQLLPVYRRLGLPAIHQQTVNWDGSNATVIAPVLAEKAFRARNLFRATDGFECHHVSMFSGEYTADAYGELIWNPEAFNETVYRRRFMRALYGRSAADTVARIYSLLEALWTAPFHRYSGWPLFDMAGTELLNAAVPRIGAVLYHYELKDGMMQLAGGPADALTTSNLLRLAAAALAQAEALADTLPGRTDALRFLKQSVKIERQYAAWVEQKFAALLLAREALARIRARNWDQAEPWAQQALETFRVAGRALDRAAAIARKYPRYFHVSEGVSRRGHECQISDFGLALRQGLWYGATIAPQAGGRNPGRRGYARFFERLARAVRVRSWAQAERARRELQEDVRRNRQSGR